jgi:ribosomal-protein-alanine N-acetyltransferase
MNPLPVRLRRMTPADLARVMEIAQSLKEAPHWPRTAYETALNPQSALQRIALVAVDAETGEVAGFAVASALPPQAELETIAVAAEGQRRGVGRILCAALAEELGIAQVQELFLEVRASNGPALGFYLSLGFRETGRRPHYYVDPVEDALLLTLRLV